MPTVTLLTIKNNASVETVIPGIRTKAVALNRIVRVRRIRVDLGPNARLRPKVIPCVFVRLGRLGTRLGLGDVEALNVRLMISVLISMRVLVRNVRIRVLDLAELALTVESKNIIRFVRAITI